jgi:hypothetical protein
VEIVDIVRMKRRIAEESRRIFVRSPERKQGISGTIFACLPDVIFALSVLNDQQFANSITVAEEDREDRGVESYITGGRRRFRSMLSSYRERM